MGVQLGRRLFYDPYTCPPTAAMSCASCHLPKRQFHRQSWRLSIGIDGIEGRRSAMSLLNVAYATNGLFWDGRSKTLEQQALKPVEDVVEMHHSVAQMRWPPSKRHPTYPEMFRKAFRDLRIGITSPKELAAKALAQFERILISSGNSKFDAFQRGNIDIFDEEELDGKLMFFDEGQGLQPARCAVFPLSRRRHPHREPLFQQRPRQRRPSHSIILKIKAEVK
jgi:cytochrome c peroxidase